MSDSLSTELSTPALDGAPQPPTAAHRRSVLLWQVVIVAILLGFIGVLAWRLWSTNVDGNRATGSAPAFSITTFDGEQLALADLAGKGVVVNFWASWCDPCREEAALLEAAWRREQANDIVFVGLDYLDQEPSARAYLAEYDITYPSGPDMKSEAARKYGILGVPETFFIDATGTIRHQVTGPIVDEASLNAMLDTIRP